MLFIVEHPAFAEFYDELLAGGLAGEVGEEGDAVNPAGDLMPVALRENYPDFDFRIPLVIREQEEELRAPSIDPATLPVSKFPLHLVKITVGKRAGRRAGPTRWPAPRPGGSPPASRSSSPPPPRRWPRSGASCGSGLRMRLLEDRGCDLVDVGLEPRRRPAQTSAIRSTDEIAAEPRSTGWPAGRECVESSARP